MFIDELGKKMVEWGKKAKNIASNKSEAELIAADPEMSREELDETVDKKTSKRPVENILEEDLSEWDGGPPFSGDEIKKALESNAPEYLRNQADELIEYIAHSSHSENDQNYRKAAILDVAANITEDRKNVLTYDELIRLQQLESVYDGDRMTMKSMIRKQRNIISDDTEIDEKYISDKPKKTQF